MLGVVVAGVTLVFSALSLGQTTTNFFSLHSYHTAGDVLSWCESADTFTTERCNQYIAASSDMLGAVTLGQKIPTKGDASYCNPGGVKLSQLRKVIAKGLNERPERLHGPAAIEILEVLAEAFPCD